ncbi:MAG: PAS domain S-box protein [Phycisphaerales bacterium]|nr:MAG: PAS domain S-box protein [Phycisphaerales bacterium]
MYDTHTISNSAAVEQLRVLIVDDDTVDCRILQTLLHRSSLSVDEIKCADSLETATQFLDENRFDLVLLDLNLPDSDDLNTLAAISENCPQAAIVVVTGERNEKVATEALAKGAQDFLVKGEFSTDVLIKAIHYACERKKTEDRARSQSEFLTNVLESLTHPFYVIDAHDHTIRMANSAACAEVQVGETTCYAISHGRNTPCDEVDHPCPMEETKRTKKPAVAEHVHYVANGDERDVEVHSYPIFDSSGNVSQVIEYSLDITDRKQAEKAMRESERRLKTILDSMLTGIAIVDSRTHEIVDVNPVAAQMIGLPREEIVGKVCHEFICPAEVGRCPITDLGQSVDRSERVVLRADGTRIPVLKSVRSVTMDGQEYLIDSFVDIADLKKAGGESDSKH